MRGGGSAVRAGTHPLVWLPGAAGTGTLVALAATQLTEVPSLGLVLAILLIGVVAAVALTKPRAALVASFLLLAFVRVEPAPVDLMLALLLGLSVALGTARSRMPVGILFALSGYVAVSILSMVSAVDVSTALRFNGITIFLLLVAVWLTGALSTDAPTTRRAMKAYVIGAAVTSLAGVVALHLPVPGSGLLLFDDYRAQGLFKDPNVFAPFLVPAACLVLEEIARPRLLQWRRRVLVATALVLVAGIVFAFSRAAWLNFLLAATVLIAVYGIRRNGLRSAARSGTVLLVAALLGLAMLVGTGSLSFFESRTTLQRYDERRFETQGEAFDRTTDHVLGYGPGQSDELLGYPPHSTYARVGTEQGVPGLIAIVAIFAVTFGAAVRLAVRDADLHGIGSATLLAAWIGLMANSFFIDTLHWRHLWIVAALIWCAAAVRHSRQAPVPAAPLRPRALSSAT